MKKTLLWTLVFLVLFAPLRFGHLELIFSNAEDDLPAAAISLFESLRVIDENETWGKDDIIEITGGIIIENGATVEIEAGAEINFKKEEESLIVPFIWIRDGNIVANGTAEEGIKFTSKQDSSGFHLIFDDSGKHESFFRYVTVEKGGGESNVGALPALCSLEKTQGKKNSIFNIAVAEEMPADPFMFLENYYPAAIFYLKGRVHFENSKFINNNDAVFYASHLFEEGEETEVQLEIVNSSFDENEKGIAVISDFNIGMNVDPWESANKLLLKNNWYGKPLGADVIREYPEDYFENSSLFNSSFSGEKVVGMFFVYEMFRSNELIADPVVIVPGITCSGRVPEVGEWKLDPILHTYDDLVDSLKKNGFIEDLNLFYFPYQWRDSNIETAKLLEQKVSEVQNETKVSKVDLVAHSMGGLVARQYVEFEDEKDSIDQLITLGTPHRGSPEAYLKWEGGVDGFLGLRGDITKNIFRAEAFHKLYGFDLHAYIQKEIPSVKELLPDYDYLFDVEKDKMREYSENYPQNEFLENLNKEKNIENLEKVDFVNIIGEVDSETSTITKIKIEDSSKKDKWEHGMPEDFYGKDRKKGLEKGNGDRTVPKFSAQGISSNKLIKFDSIHSKLPTKAQCRVFTELTKKEDCSYDEDTTITNVLTFGILSPIDVQIVAPDGKRIGKNFKTNEIFDEIEDAFYSGFETENEFVTIPNPQDGEYKILTQGVGDGDYRIEVARIQEEEDGMSEESMVVFEGIAETGKEEERTVEVSADGLLGAEEADEVPPTIEISAPADEEKYTNNVDLKIDVKVEDDVSLQENVEIQMTLDENLFEGDKLNLPLMTLGQHVFKVQATDEAGNEVVEETAFSVETNIDALISNVSYYYDEGLIKNKREERILNFMFSSIKRLMIYKDQFLRYRKFYWKNDAREKMFERMINGRIDSVTSFIERRSERFIDEVASDLLIESLQYIKNK